MAEGFQTRGNEAFKRRSHKEAAAFYTQAIDARPSDQTLENLYTNRALCNLLLGPSLSNMY